MQSNMKKFVRGSLGLFLSLILVFGAVLTYVPKAEAAGKVKSIAVKNLPAKTLTLKKGKSKVLKVKVTVQGKKVSKKVTFKSSKPKVATVSAKGKITAKKPARQTLPLHPRQIRRKKSWSKLR